MEQTRAGRILFGGILFVVSTFLFLSAAKVALSSRTDGSGSESFQPQVDPSLKRKLFHTPVTPQPSRAQASLTSDDFDRVYREDLVAVASPAGSDPEAVLATILEDQFLPAYIRAPFVALAKAKAPHLLATEEAAQF